MVALKPDFKCQVCHAAGGRIRLRQPLRVNIHALTPVRVPGRRRAQSPVLTQGHGGLSRACSLPGPTGHLSMPCSVSLSPEFVNGRAVLGDVSQVQGLIPFWTPVIVIALYRCCRFLEAYVIKPSKRSTADVFDGVVGDQELLLPPHEDKVIVLQILVIKVIWVKCFCVLVKGWELPPMFTINVFICIPLPR